MEITLKLPFLGKSGEGSPVLGKDNELLASLLHGKYYAAVKRGRVFSQATTPLGLAIPIYTSTAPVGCVLWNPPGSGVNAILMQANLEQVSGVTAFSAIGLMVRTANIPASLGTGANITAFAEVTPINGMPNSGKVSKIKSSNAGTITIAAGVAAEFVRALASIHPEIDTTARATTKTPIDFDGAPVLVPGSLAWFAGTVASVALFAQHLVWEEEDVD